MTPALYQELRENLITHQFAGTIGNTMHNYRAGG
jgi:hypothetical protein